MKHKITWRMEGVVEFDTDETDPRRIADDFDNAQQEGFDFMRYGDCNSFDVIEVDDEHVHNWILSYFKDNEFCPLCSQKRPVSA